MLPTVSSLRRSIRHAREKENSDPSVPLSLSELTIPPQYQNTAKGDKFLLYDSKDDDRVLIFGTKKNLELLSNSTTWMMDGTFQTVPALFYQLYTIHGEIRDAYFPLVFGLLPKKSEAIYVKPTANHTVKWEFFSVDSYLCKKPEVTPLAGLCLNKEDVGEDNAGAFLSACASPGSPT